MAYSGGYSGGGGNPYEAAIRQREQSYESPMRQQYGGMGASMMDRMGPSRQVQPSAPAPRNLMSGGMPSMPGSPPTPVYTGRMQMNGMGTAGAQPGMGTQGGYDWGAASGANDAMWQGMGAQRSGGQPQMSGFDEQILQLPQDMQERLNEFNVANYSGPDYKGRHEANQMLKAQYAQMLMRLAAQPEIDYSGSSEVADQFNNQRSRLTSDLGARGFGGSGIEAGALANSYGNQARAQGAFNRDAQEQRRREELAQQIAFENWARGIQGKGLQRNWAEQDAPSFFDKALGVVGGVAGSLIPGVGDVVGGLFGGGDPTRPGGANYSGQYPPVDWNDEYAFGYGG